MRRNEKYENDTTPSRTVVESYRASIGADVGEASLALVHYRGGREEFELGLEYSRSPDPLDRETGADVLAQLGWADRSFLDESVDLLVSMLDDPEDDVVAAAAVALGHRADPRAVPALIKLAGHSNPQVRLGVAHGLSGHDAPDALGSMAQLSHDTDHDVRNWATFGLGSMVESDTPEIRDALRANLTDSDHEIRGEALMGLASRGDPDVPDLLIREWQSSESVSLLSVEAAEIAAAPELLPHLESLGGELQIDDDQNFKSTLGRAVKACRGVISGSDLVTLCTHES